MAHQLAATVYRYVSFHERSSVQRTREDYLPIWTKLAVGVGNLVAGTHAKAGRHCAWLGSRVQATDLFTKLTP
jgi:hypothetical protein